MYSISCILGGLFIALAGYCSTVVSSTFLIYPDTQIIGKILSALVFPIGIIFTLIGNGILFTTKCADIRYPKETLTLIPVWILNLLGVGLFCLLLYSGNYISNSIDIKIAIFKLAKTKIEYSGWHYLIGGILCNILVCFGAIAYSKLQDKLVGLIIVYLSIFAFVMCGFEHSVANMYYLISGLMVSNDIDIVVGATNLLNATIGNLISGLIIGAIYEHN